MFGVWMFLDKRKANRNLFYFKIRKSQFFWLRLILLIICLSRNLTYASPLPNDLEALPEQDDENIFPNDDGNIPENTKTDLENNYLNYIMKAASYNHQMYSNKLQRHLNFPSNQIRKVFKLDKNLQRLEKKSWKIPMKTVALYTEDKNANILGDLAAIITKFKDS
ncbi:unnamed protein product [Brachionus calyciflorus]|uniref:Uncharacterized protein n=1 Tax=Brachionus calyciflorus TaxID=104777 RepID=A0A814KGE4_9BILA|nr:unnamed protein product [Brachionus calyciflorus]